MVLTQSLLNVLNFFKYNKIPHVDTLTLALNYSKCNSSPTGAKFETLENNKVYTKMWHYASFAQCSSQEPWDFNS